MKKISSNPSEIIDRLLKTENNYEKNEKIKNFEAFKTRKLMISGKKSDKNFITLKKRSFHSNFINKDQNSRQNTPMNHHSILSICDYHLLKNFKTVANHHKLNQNSEEEYYTSLTKANLDKYLSLFYTFNRIEREKTRFLEQASKNEVQLNVKNNCLDSSNRYIRDLKEKDLNGNFLFYGE